MYVRLMALGHESAVRRQTAQHKPGRNSVAQDASSVGAKASSVGHVANSVGFGANTVGPDVNSVISYTNRLRALTGCWVETFSTRVCEAQQVPRCAFCGCIIAVLLQLGPLFYLTSVPITFFR
ncbi:hypothetical protein ABBQ38_012911 [Trebouxia sp. C0009 RCD-2024]